MKKKNKATKIPRRFAQLIHDLAEVYAIRVCAKRVGFALAKDDSAFIREQRNKWKEAKSFAATRDDRNKIRKMVIMYAREVFKV